MPDPQHLDPGSPLGNPIVKAVAWGATAAASAMTWAFKTFQTKKSAIAHAAEDDAKFVKKVEADGTRAYVHPEEWEEMKKRMDDSIAQGEKWQAIVKDWIKNP